MTERNRQIDAFLGEYGQSYASLRPLAGDASNRRYFRFSRGGTPYVLMDAPPASGEDVRPFVRIAEWLSGAGFSAPKIHKKHEEHGLLLLEDLGDDLIARMIEADPLREMDLYAGATDVLVQLHQCEAPQGLTRYTPYVMADMTSPVFDWYLRGCGEETASHDTFVSRFRDILGAHCGDNNVAILRDYHAENLLWLPSRKGVAKIGLLDFQDALIGHRAYDLVSLMHDIRRDVSPDVEQAMIRRYLDAMGLEAQEFEAAFAALGLQRNLRITGIFARLCLHVGRPHYVDYLPRVWALILRELEHPALASMRSIVLDTIPPPTPAILKKLKDQCATIQTP